MKAGQPLFQFDRRPYEYKVQQVEAQLAEARQNVLVLQADVEVAMQRVARANVELDFEQYQKRMFQTLVKEQAVREEQIVQTDTRVNSAQATSTGAMAELERARLKYTSEINGVNTTVAGLEAQLRQARYYLDNTTMTAPEDGRIINLQVRPGMVSGIYRVGGMSCGGCATAVTRAIMRTDPASQVTVDVAGGKVTVSGGASEAAIAAAIAAAGFTYEGVAEAGR